MRRLGLAVLFLLAGCAADDGAQLVFELDHTLTTPAQFFDAPWPSDLRVDDGGHPIVDGWPTRDSALFVGLRDIAKERRGFPVLPVAYFRFTRPVGARSLDAIVPATASSEILLVDIDPASPERGRLLPTVARTWSPTTTCPRTCSRSRRVPASSSRRRAAMPSSSCARRATRRAAPVGGAGDRALADGHAPSGSARRRGRAAYAPLFATLTTLGVDAHEVAAATVFTTGDVVNETADALDAHPRAQPRRHPRPRRRSRRRRHSRSLLRAVGKVTLPQFQKGTPPFDTGRQLRLRHRRPADAKQRGRDAPITSRCRSYADAGGRLSARRSTSTARAGSAAGGRSRATSDAGRHPTEPGKGPRTCSAPHGFATAASALPVNPERLPGAERASRTSTSTTSPRSATSFRQGIIEQRLFIEALRSSRSPRRWLTACNGPALPAGATRVPLRPASLVAQGQSMGGMYTNLVGAVEPACVRVVPTGAGGFWSLFVIVTNADSHGTQLLAAVLASTPARSRSCTRACSCSRRRGSRPSRSCTCRASAHRPLPAIRCGRSTSRSARTTATSRRRSTTPSRSRTITRRPATSCGRDAGRARARRARRRARLSGRATTARPRPVRPTPASSCSTLGDGYSDPHAIFAQLDAVKYQYGCFLETFLKTGKAVLAAPAPLGTPCPQP